MTRRLAQIIKEIVEKQSMIDDGNGDYAVQDDLNRLEDELRESILDDVSLNHGDLKMEITTLLDQRDMGGLTKLSTPDSIGSSSSQEKMNEIYCRL